MPFAIFFSDVQDMGRPFQFIIYNDIKEFSFCYFSYTNSIYNNVIYTSSWISWCEEQNMKLVLSIFSDNLFAFTQAYVFAISSFILWLRSLRSLLVQNRFVSSAKSIGMKSSDTLGTSFIYIFIYIYIYIRKAGVQEWNPAEHYILAICIPIHRGFAYTLWSIHWWSFLCRLTPWFCRHTPWPAFWSGRCVGVRDSVLLFSNHFTQHTSVSVEPIDIRCPDYITMGFITLGLQCPGHQVFGCFVKNSHWFSNV